MATALLPGCEGLALFRALAVRFGNMTLVSAPIMFYNTLGRRLETFVPLDSGTASIYTCGPTVYAYQHVGNLRAYVFADTLRRVLEWKSYAVRHVINITDVGHLTSDMDEGSDKLEVAATREGRSVWAIAEHYADAFFADLRELRVQMPATWAYATAHVEEMIDFARTLEDKGFAYRTEAGLYFDTSRAHDYGKLALLDVGGLREGARVAPVHGKRTATDFALWRASPPDVARLMEWDSPWGRGAPGWHLECSVLSMKHLGPRFDIHTGGADHISVHHTNEIVQSEAYLGGPWVRYWLHNEFLNLRNAKISKSRGATILLRDVMEAGFHPLTYRFFLLGSQYRNQIEFTWAGLEGARTAHIRLLERIRTDRSDKLHPMTHDEAAAHLEGPARAYLTEFDEAVADDLNTARAVAVLTRFSHDATLSPSDVAVLARAFEAILAIGLTDLMPTDVEPAAATIMVFSDNEIDELIERRDAARSRGDFTTADAIRGELEAAGVLIQDTAAGTRWLPRRN